MAGEREDKQSAIASPIRKFGFIVALALQLAAVPTASAQMVSDPPQSLTAANHPSTTFIQVTLTWETPDNTGDSPITQVCHRYRRYQLDPPPHWSLYSTPTCVSVSNLGDVNEVVIGNLQVGDLHEFNVALRNDAGLSKWAWVRFTPGFSPTLAVQPISVAENAAATTVTVTATLGDRVTLRKAVPVTVSVGGGTATAGTDYDVVDDFTVTVSAGSLSGMGTFTLTPIDNDVDEGNETIEISGTATGFVNIAGAKLTITDDDMRGLKLSKDSVTVTEAAGLGRTATYTVALTSQPTAAVTVAVSSGDENAATVKPTTLSFTTTNWKQGQTVTVTGVDDQVDNTPDRTATISHSASGGDYASVSEDLTVTVTDDAAPTGITLTVDADTGTTGVQTSVTENGGAKTVRVTATVNGATRYPDAKTVTVAVGASGDTATEGTDYDTVADLTITIGAGAQSGSTTFTLTPTNDALDEGNEKISLDGTSSGGETVTDAEITITDDDAAPTGITDTPPTFSIAGARATEGDAMVFTVTRSGARRSTVSVNWTSVADTAGAQPAETGEDYVAAAGVLRFSAGEVSRTVVVQTVEDAMDEEDETFLVRLSAAGGTGVIAPGAGGATGTIVDDDEPPMVSIADATPVVEGDTARFRVWLSGPSGKTIAVDCATSSGTATEDVDYLGNKETLTLAAESVEAVIEVATIDDEEIENAPETFKVTLSNLVNATMGDAEATGFIEEDVRPKAIARLRRVNEAILPQVGSALMRIRIEQVTLRIEQVVSGRKEGELSLLGRRISDDEGAFVREERYLKPEERSLVERLRDEADGFVREERSLAEIVGGARFLRTWRKDREKAGAGDMGFYAGGDWHRLSSIDDGPFAWDGNLSDAHLGGSVRLGGSALAGLDVVLHRSSVVWSETAGGEFFEGDWRMRLSAAYPYAAWFTPKGSKLWAMAGYGSGVIRIKEETPLDQSADLGMKSIAFGGALPLWKGESGVSLRLRGDAWHGVFDVGDNGDLVKGLSIRVQGVRVFGEGDWRRSLEDGASLTPSARIGFQYDEGAGGAGGEVGSGLRWEHPSRGWAVAVRGRALLVREGVREWGVGAEMRLSPMDGIGPLLNLSVSRGDTADGTEALWERELETRADEDDDGAYSLDVEAGWGIGLPDGRGVLTPFAGLSLSEGEARTVRLGGRWESGNRVRLELEARREERGDDRPDHGLLLRATATW